MYRVRLHIQLHYYVIMLLHTTKEHWEYDAPLPVLWRNAMEQRTRGKF
ncbi:hypothetical protein CCP3SC1_390009 [Gammaproteobacteria bacterium]